MGNEVEITRCEVRVRCMVGKPIKEIKPRRGTALKMNLMMRGIFKSRGNVKIVVGGERLWSRIKKRKADEEEASRRWNRDRSDRGKIWEGEALSFLS